MAQLRPGRKHIWVERNNNASGPFYVTAVDGNLATIERLPSKAVEVLDMGDDPHFVVQARNSFVLAARRGDVTATLTKGEGWLLAVTGKDLGPLAKATGSTLVGRRLRTRGGFAALAKLAAKHLGVSAWARDRFGGWVPADDWRAVTAGVPCNTSRGCDKVAVNDGLCALHASSKARVEANDAARAERFSAQQAERARRRETRRSCTETLERLRPLLAELGIHPDTLSVGSGEGDRLGILMPAEVAERLTVAAVEGEPLLADFDRS